MKAEEKAEYLIVLFGNKILAGIFCDEMIKEWKEEYGRTAKQSYWAVVKLHVTMAI